MKDVVRNILTVQHGVLLPWAERRQYKSWPADFADKNQREAEERVADIRITFADLTSSEAETLGFGLWDESGLRLVPLWLYDHIAEGQELTCISGEKVVVGPDYKTQGVAGYIDNDHRGGMIAWGFMPADLKGGA